MIEYNKRTIRSWSLLGASGVLGLAACDIAEEDDDFAIVTSDLCFFSGLNRFEAVHRDKLYNVGIAEQNMIGIAAGMTKEGMNVFATSYASFAATRVLDQVKVNMGYMKLPIKLIGLTSGYAAGILGATHMAIEDIAIMRSIPNITILSPADCVETMKVLQTASKMSVPVYIRLGSDIKTPAVPIYKEDYDFQVGKAITLRRGTDICLIATGTMVSVSLDAANILQEKGYSCEVINIHTVKPIDREAVLSVCDKKLLITIEEHSVIGGLGSAVAEVLASAEHRPPHIIMGINDEYLHAASHKALLEKSGLTVQQVCKRIINYIRKEEK